MTDWYAEVMGSKDAPASIEDAYKKGKLWAVPGGLDTPTNIHGEHPSSEGTAFLSGFMEDDDAKIRLFARNRFPNVPIEEAVKRYGVVGGKIVYVDEEGRLQKELDGTAAAVAAAARYGPAMVGGAALAPLGPVGMGVGAAGGEGWRRTIGGLAGDPQNAGDNIAAMGTEGLVSGAAGLAGAGYASKVANRNIAYDIAKLDPTKAEDIINLGRKYGITVTPAEASGLGSLISQQTRLGMGFDEAGDILRDFYLRRANATGRMIERFTGTKKTPSSSETGMYLREKAKRTIAAAKEERKRASEPLYKKWVNDPNVQIGPGAMHNILSDPDYGKTIRYAIDKVKGEPLYGVQDAPENSLKVLDLVYRDLRDTAYDMSTHSQGTKAHYAGGAADKLKGYLDALYPEYAAARKAFEEASPAVTRLTTGIEGVLSEIKDENLHQAARRVFASNEVSPETVRRARMMFSLKGEQKQWNQVVNRWLKYKWMETADGSDIRVLSKASNWRKQVFGDENARQIMKEALGKRRYKAFEDMMELIDATSRVPKGQSMTEPAQMAARGEANAAAPIAAKMEGFGLRGVRQWWIDAQVRDYRTQLAKVITNEKAMSTLEQMSHLKSINPANPANYELLALALAQAGVEGFSEAFGDMPEDRPPTAIQPPMRR